MPFYQKYNHFVIKGSVLIPNDDKTFLWINSGVATLKKQYYGREMALNNHLVNIQKSIHQMILKMFVKLQDVTLFLK